MWLVKKLLSEWDEAYIVVCVMRTECSGLMKAGLRKSFAITQGAE